MRTARRPRPLPRILERPVRIAALLPLDHFHAPVVLRALASGEGTEVLAITTPKLTEFRGRRKGLGTITRESGLGYLRAMAFMKAWYSLRATWERAAGVAIERRRFFTVRETLAALACKHHHFDSAATKECVECVGDFAPDLLFSVFFNQLVPSEICSLAGRAGIGGAYNVHPAPLPAYRGISPAFWMLCDGAEQGGATIHELTASLDQGGYAAQARFPVGARDSVFGLYRRSAEAAADCAREIVANVRRGEQPPVLPPALPAGCYRSKITRAAVATLRRRGRRFFRWSGE